MEEGIYHNRSVRDLPRLDKPFPMAHVSLS